jgi:hypothetical protein
LAARMPGGLRPAEALITRYVLRVYGRDAGVERPRDTIACCNHPLYQVLQNATPTGASLRQRGSFLYGLDFGGLLLNPVSAGRPQTP